MDAVSLRKQTGWPRPIWSSVSGVEEMDDPAAESFWASEGVRLLAWERRMSGARRAWFSSMSTMECWPKIAPRT